MNATACLRTPDGTIVRLTAGELIGRSWCASLQLDDPRVSEAHALLSLRGDQLKLLPLRGRLVHDGRRVDELVLEAGQTVLLAPDVRLEVLEVELPETGPALIGDGLPPTLLPPSSALALRPEPVLTHASSHDARAWIWVHQERVRVRTDEVVDLRPGESFQLDGRRFELIELPMRSARPTVGRPAPMPGMRVICRYETVHLFRPGQPPAVLDGIPAQLVSELVAFDAPVPWRMLAEALWGTSVEEFKLRKRLDGALARLRSVLRRGGVREDLVRSNGRGQMELFLHPTDQVEDRT